MSITPAELFKAKKFPKWISGHSIFKEVKKIHKVFPGIGLPNTVDDRKVDTVKAASAAAVQLASAIENAISNRAHKLKAFGDTHPKMGKERRAELDRIVSLLDNVKSAISENRSKCASVVKDRVSVIMPKDITEPGAKRPIFRQNESLFRVFNKLNDQLKEPKFASMGRVENFAEFKKFSADNVPAHKFKVVFSSDGPEGLWDVATMSMRGVRSCQSWDGGAYKYGTIGSMIDPFVGIIYLTTGEKFNDFGSKMIKRCVVRYIIDGKARKPYIALDTMYPNFDQNVLDQFVGFIKEHTGLNVEYAPLLHGREVMKNSYIPLTEVRKKLEKYGPQLSDAKSIVAYQDVRFANDNSAPKEELFDKNAKKKANRFAKHFSKAAIEALKTVSADSFPEHTQAAIKMLKGDDKKFFSYAHIVPQLMSNVAKSFVDTVNKSDFANSDTYIRRVYYNFFNQREKAFDSIKTKFVRELNGQLGLKAKNRLRSDHVVAIMQIILSKTDSIMKEDLHKIVSKRKFSGPIPLPEPKTKEQLNTVADNQNTAVAATHEEQSQ